MAFRTIVVVALAALLPMACSSSSDRSASGNAQKGSAAAPATTSPLGLGMPDPEAIVTALFQRMEAQDFAGTCALLAAPRKSDGRPVPLIPGKNVNEPKTVWAPLSEVGGFRSFLAEPWKKFEFGRPRSIANEPPFVAVPVRVRYDWNAVPERERARTLAAASSQAGREVGWAEFVANQQSIIAATERGEGEIPELGFVYLDGQWRLFIEPLPERGRG